MSALKVENVSKIFPAINKSHAVQALQDISLEVKTNEFVSILGHSGCGKSTLFQDYALFPWLTVRDNIAFGLNIKGIDAATINQKVDHFANLVGLGAFVESYPHQLSGGMRQRVSIARAFAVDPTVLLMDEPFAALDAQNRAMMQKEMIRILAEESKTVVLVTHSIEESINLSDVIIIMTRRPGRVKEVIRVPEPRRMVEDTPSYLEVRRKIRDLISDEHDLSDVS